MQPQVQIRRARRYECEALSRITYHAVHEGAPLYTPAQRLAWRPERETTTRWSERLETQAVWVADAAGIGPVGLITLRPDGYVDYAYILPDWQGRGLFSRLYAALEAHALAQGLSRLWVHASLHAAPAFARHGYQTVRDDPVERNGQVLMRHEMEKQLGAAKGRFCAICP